MLASEFLPKLVQRSEPNWPKEDMWTASHACESRDRGKAATVFMGTANMRFAVQTMPLWFNMEFEVS